MTALLFCSCCSNGHDIIINLDSSGSFNGYTNVINGVSSTVEYLGNGVNINGTQRMSQTYDNFDRLSSSKLHLGSEYVTNYTYLNGINVAQTTSLIETMQNGNNTLKYTYDDNGNIETISEKVGADSYAQKVKYYYDGLNQLIREDNLYINKTVTLTIFCLFS